MSISAFISFQVLPSRVAHAQGRDDGGVGSGGVARDVPGRPRLSVKLFVRMRSQGRLLRRSLFFCLFMVSKSAEAMLVNRGFGPMGGSIGPAGGGGAGGDGGGGGGGGLPPRDNRPDFDDDDEDVTNLRYFINTRTGGPC